MCVSSGVPARWQLPPKSPKSPKFLDLVGERTTCGRNPCLLMQRALFWCSRSWAAPGCRPTRALEPRAGAPRVKHTHPRPTARTGTCHGRHGRPSRRQQMGRLAHSGSSFHGLGLTEVAIRPFGTDVESRPFRLRETSPAMPVHDISSTDVPGEPERWPHQHRRCVNARQEPN